jgi:hypothetical protein
MNEIDIGRKIFGRHDLTELEWAFIKHVVYGPHMCAPGGPYGLVWVGEGPSPFEKAIEGASIEMFKEWYTLQLKTCLQKALTLMKEGGADELVYGGIPTDKISNFFDHAEILLGEE